MKRLRLWLGYGLLLVLLVSCGLVVLERQALGDWFVLRNYQPPVDIATLASDDTMTDAGKHLFYVNHPQLEDKTGFNANCTSKTEHSVVLGCYHGDRQGIHIYNVQDARLEGVKQVTAAHEMLHQAYDRLSKTERKRIDTLLEQVENQSDLSQRIKDKIALYREKDADSVRNEMHSIFGTEVAVLPTELEAYYKQYFGDRSAIVAFSDKYQAEFADRKAKVDSYDTQLKQLESQITANRADLEARKQSLSAQRNDVQALLARGDTAGYRAGAAAYNQQVNAYNTLIDQTQSLIQEYNRIVAERNAISTEEQQLQQALDSRQESTTP